MAYIGNPPISGNFQVCDAISVVNGQAAYTMQVSSANVSPESANHMLVSLNGVLQKPGSSFTISGSTITFASNLATGDVIDFILLLGNVNDIGTPSDATVTNAKTNFTTTSSAAGLQIKGDGTTAGALQLNCEQNSHGIKLQSPAHSANQSYTIKFPTGNITAEKFLRVASVSGSGTTGIGQLDFADAGGGSFEKLVTTTISSSTASVEFNNTYLTSAYRDYRVIITGLESTADDGQLVFRFSDDNGSSFDSSSNYNQNAFGGRSNNASTGSPSGRNIQDNSRFQLTGANENIGNGTGESCFWHLDIFDPLNQNSDNSFATVMWQCCILDADGKVGAGVGAGVFDKSGSEDTAFNAIKLFMNSGNIDKGSFTLYGRKI
tara:strand:- start:246 stop:1379 length:1134 start_codon:yes stop_codon:yes gene_type:complete